MTEIKDSKDEHWFIKIYRRSLKDKESIFTTFVILGYILLFGVTTIYRLLSWRDIL